MTVQETKNPKRNSISLAFLWICIFGIFAVLYLLFSHINEVENKHKQTVIALNEKIAQAEQRISTLNKSNLMLKEQVKQAERKISALLATPKPKITSKPQVKPFSTTVAMKDLNFTIQDSTGNSKTLSTKISFVLETKPDEIVKNVQILPADWTEFENAVKKLEPHIRDALTDYITQQTAQLNSPRGKKRLKVFLRDFVNDKLEKTHIKLSNSKILKRRVSKILITHWIMM